MNIQNSSFYYILLLLISFAVAGCEKDEKCFDIVGSKQLLRFTDADFTPGIAEEITCSSARQTITLKVLSLEDPDAPYPTNLHLSFAEWDEEKDDWNEASLPSDVNQPDDFYHAWTEEENGIPVIKINLWRNDTGEERKILIQATSNKTYNQNLIYGQIIIIQLPESNKSAYFTLNAKYKGKMYSTTAELDENDKYIFHSKEYDQLMTEIDSLPNIEMVIFDSNTIYYYDEEDIRANRPYEDAVSMEISDTAVTRGNGFEDFNTSYLGFVSLYNNDHFGGSKLSKGLTNFHFTWNLPNLKDYGMNDKVTSIAVAFNHYDPVVCTVLTVWDDTDYNHGDKYRSKHRISIVASRFSPRVECVDLKKIKKIGSSSSWNDCISSISFHFGYLNSLFLDY